MPVDAAATPGKESAAVPNTPVIKPKKGLLKLAGEVLDHGGPGYLQSHLA